MSNRDGQNSENKSDESSKESGLDLGLGLFLNPQDPSSSGETADKANNSEQESGNQATKVETVEQIVELSEFEKLAKEKQWSSVLSASESILEDQQVRQESSNQWIEAQAWWILAQLELKSLPAGVLAAPLESMLDHLVGSGASAAKSAETDKEASLKAEKNLMLVKSAAAHLVDRYFSQGEMVAGMQLASRSRVLGGDLSALVSVVKNNAAKFAALEGSDQRLYSILCKELSIESLSKSSERFTSTLSTSTSSDASKDLKFADLNKKSNSFFFSTIIIFLLLLAIAAILFWLWATPAPVPPFPNQTSKLELPNPSLEAPKPEPVSKVSELDAVLYGMGNKERNNVQGSTAPAKVAVATSPIPAATVKPRVALDTKGPVESPGLRDLRGERERSKPDRDQRPDIVVPGPAIAPRFENYPNPKVYKVLRATNLMLKPSLNSDPVAGLNRGDKVKVVGMAGYWLKVMSRQGRVAYVLAEDTEPE